MKPGMLQSAAIAGIAAAVIFSTGWFIGDSGRSLSWVSNAQAAGGAVKGPNEIAPDRYVFYPGTLFLAKV